MAPEQFRNAKNADVRCDIYALGATLYMMVTGEMPFRSNGPLDAWMKKIHNEMTPPRELVPDLSERVDWAIRRAMSADPEKRPTTCREFVEDLTGHSTRKITPAENSGPSADLWYLVYKDDLGATHTVKGTTTAIRRSLKEGLLGDASNVRASKEKTGPFDPVRSYPEFRDLVVVPGALDTPTTSNSTPKTPIPVSDFNGRHRPLSAAAIKEHTGPHIDFATASRSGAKGNTSPQTVEGLVWFLILLVVALTTAMVGYFWLLPNL
jgi:serine/threonine protein kinase